MNQTNIISRFIKVSDTLTLEEILNRIKSGTYEKEISRIRSAISQGKLEEADNYKKQLLGFTPSGTFKKKRHIDNLIKYQGIVIVDIDKLDKNAIEPLRTQVNEHPCTLASFVSPSGKGIKILVKVPQDYERHREAFDAVNNTYAHYLKVETDLSGKDIPRLCFVSHDPHLFFNPEAETFIPQASEKISTMKDFDQILKFTQEKHEYTQGNRNNFIYSLSCNLNKAGWEEKDAIKAVTKFSDLSLSEIKSTVKSAFKNKDDHGKGVKKSKSSSRKSVKEKQKQVEDWLKKNYDLRYNIVTLRLEFKKSNELEYSTMSDYEENTILRELLINNIPTSMHQLRVTLESNFVTQYDPFKDYFENLAPYDDNDTDFIDKLADTVSTSNQKYWKHCFKKWLTAMVATAVDPDTINHTVIIFTGNQGIGKTTWMENLVPPELKPYLYSGTINPNNKDTLIHLSECILINLDELENLNKSEVGTLKEVITKSQIRMRRAYGHNSEHLPRRASLAGSVNTKQFLNDSTGSRRFLCFEVDKINYQHNIAIDKVLAQAYHLYKSGFRYWFNKKEIAEITENNEQYQTQNVSEEQLLTYFRKPKDGEKPQYLSATQVIRYINIYSDLKTTNTNSIAMGRALNKHEFKKLKKQGRVVYEVVPKSDREIELEKSDQDPQDDNPFN